MKVFIRPTPLWLSVLLPVLLSALTAGAATIYLYTGSFVVPPNGTSTHAAEGAATSLANYASTPLYFQNSTWSGSAPVTNTSTLVLDSSGNLDFKYNGTTIWSISLAGTVTTPNLVLTGLAASTPTCTTSGSQLSTTCATLSPTYAAMTLSGLGASAAVCTNASKQLATAGCVQPGGYTTYANTTFVYTNVTSTLDLATATLTLGTSGGPIGAWLVVVRTATSINFTGSAGQSFSLCIESAAAGTNGVGDVGSASCAADAGQSVLAYQTAFAPGLGTTHTYGWPMSVQYSAQYANGTHLSFTCQGYGGATAGFYGGPCLIRAFQI